MVLRMTQLLALQIVRVALRHISWIITASAMHVQRESNAMKLAPPWKIYTSKRASIDLVGLRRKSPYARNPPIVSEGTAPETRSVPKARRAHCVSREYHHA